MKVYQFRNCLSKVGNLKRIYILDDKNILTKIDEENFLVDGDAVVIGTREQLLRYSELEADLSSDDI